MRCNAWQAAAAALQLYVVVVMPVRSMPDRHPICFQGRPDYPWYMHTVDLDGRYSARMIVRMQACSLPKIVALVLAPALALYVQIMPPCPVLPKRRPDTELAATECCTARYRNHRAVTGAHGSGDMRTRSGLCGRASRREAWRDELGAKRHPSMSLPQRVHLPALRDEP